MIISLSVSFCACESQKDIENRIILSQDFQNAQSSFESGNYNEALRLYTTVIHQYPDQHWLYLQRGEVYYNMEEYDKALSDYKNVISAKNEDLGQALLRSALIYFYSDKLDDAESIFKQITQLGSTRFNNEKWSAYYHLGQIHYKRGRFEEAIENYNKADEFSKTELTNYHKANAYHALGKSKLAIELYKRSIQFVKRDYIEKHPDSYLAQCDTCGFPFGSKEYEMLTVVQKGDHINTWKKIQENELIKDIISNPMKYKDTVMIINFDDTL